MSTAAGGSSPQELRISADAHMGEPPDLWERELPAKFKARALQFDDKPFETNHHLRAGCWDPHERLKDLAMDGISAEVLYPTLAVGAWLLDDHELQEAHLRVYNDWMIDFCSVAPHRYWGLGMVSLWNVEHAIGEMRRFIKAGLRGVDIWIAPPAGLPYSSERYEPFWAAAQELGATVNMHINGRAESRERDPAAIPIHSINGHKFDAMNSLLHIIGSGVLERYPLLNVAVAEAGAGWAPFWLQEADHYTMSRRTILPMPPSEYFKRQVYCAFIIDAVGAYLLHDFGQDNFMWSNDYPHPACTWPRLSYPDTGRARTSPQRRPGESRLANGGQGVQQRRAPSPAGPARRSRGNRALARTSPGLWGQRSPEAQPRQLISILPSRRRVRIEEAVEHVEQTINVE